MISTDKVEKFSVIRSAKGHALSKDVVHTRRDLTRQPSVQGSCALIKPDDPYLMNIRRLGCHSIDKLLYPRHGASERLRLGCTSVHGNHQMLPAVLMIVCQGDDASHNRILCTDSRDRRRFLPKQLFDLRYVMTAPCPYRCRRPRRGPLTVRRSPPTSDINMIGRR